MFHAIVFSTLAMTNPVMQTTTTTTTARRTTQPIVRSHAIEGVPAIDDAPSSTRLYAMHGYVIALPSNFHFGLRLRSGRMLAVDGGYAIPRGLAGPLLPGRPVTVNGYFDRSGVLHAVNVESVDEENARYWPADAPLTDPHLRTKADVRMSPFTHL
jgi:hypothetical protein